VRGIAFAALIALVAAAAAVAANAQDRGKDGRWARAIVVRQEDLPMWDAEAPSSGKTCLPAHLDGQTAFARSQQFSSRSQSVTARAWVFPEERHATTGFRRLVALDYAKCLSREGVVGARIVRTKQERFGAATTGDRFRGIRVTAHVVQSGIRFTVYVDLVFLRRGRAVAVAAFTSTGVPLGEAAEWSTVGRMSTRMRRPPG
jgi:hypothetical protein